MPNRLVLHRSHNNLVKAEEMADWLEPRVNADLELLEPFLNWLLSEEFTEAEDLAGLFASNRVIDPYDPETGNEMLGIQRYEERALENPERAGGVLYDGFAVQRGLYEQMPGEEHDESVLHVALMDRALGTWGDHDGRWHKRVVVLGEPALVSVPGLYEAPAKPEEYYKAKQKHALATGDAPPREVLENQVDGDFLVEDDPRTTEALKGYVLQAVQYHVSGEAFCDDEGCRLYNAHRHGELFDAQLRGSEFCSDHAGYRR